MATTEVGYGYELDTSFLAAPALHGPAARLLDDLD